MIYFNSEIIIKLIQFYDYLLISHYSNYGYREGRESHPFYIRENFITKFKTAKTLVIGPFAKPILIHNNVKYFYVLNNSELLNRTIKQGLNILNLPFINFVSKNCGLNVVNGKFNLVFQVIN